MKRFIFLGVLIFLCGGVFGASVTPGIYSLNFESGYGGDFSFEFGFEPEVEAELYISGDLAKYVALDKEILIGGGVVVATLNLPHELNLSGENRIRIGAQQIGSGESATGIVSNVWGIIKVNVPYSGGHVELDLKAPNANAGDLVNFSAEIFNRGDEDVNVDLNIQIFREEDFIENIDLGDRDVALMDSVIVNYSFDSSSLSPGDYVSVISGDYGLEQIATDENPFRLGELLVKIVNYTLEFEEDKIDRFYIEVESFYNNLIDDLYAEVNVVGVADSDFITPVGELRAWRTKTIEGFLDTSNIDSEDFQAEIILHYGGETTLEIVDLKIIKGYDYIFLLVLIGSILVVGFLVWRVIVFVKQASKNAGGRKK